MLSHTVAPRLDAKASRVAKDHGSVELSRILQRANALSMSSIHSVTAKHAVGLGAPMLCFILFQLGAMTSRFSMFFCEDALSRGFCHDGLPPSQEGIFGIEVGTLCTTILTKLRFLLIRYNIRKNMNRKVWYPQTLRGLIT